MGYRVAVVGATGNVGRELFNILEEVNFPVDKIHAIASRKSIGVEVSFGEKILKCEDIEQFDFSKVDIVLMSAGGAVSKEWSEKIGKAGPIVIDNSSAFRKDPDVPLIVPEVNPDAIKQAKKKKIEMQGRAVRSCEQLKKCSFLLSLALPWKVNHVENSIDGFGRNTTCLCVWIGA